MYKFFLKVINDDVHQSQITIYAENKKDALEQIKNKKLHILSMKKVSSDEKSFFSIKGLRDFFRKINVVSVSTKNLFLFTRQLFLLLDAGLPLVRCFKVLKKQKKSFLTKSMICGLEEDLLAGKKFSEALRQYPFVFKNIYVSMISSGEKGGQLPLVMKHLSDFFEQSYTLRKKFLSSLFYPFLILMSVMIVIFILILFVVPKFKKIFLDLNINLPYPTKMLLFLSSFLQHYFFSIIFVIMLLFLLIKFCSLSEKMKLNYDRFVLKIPFWGSLCQKMETLNFCRLMGMLLNNGVPILESFDISRSVCKNKAFQEAFEKIQSKVKEGESVSQSFEDTEIFPYMLVNMIEIGEHSGQLDKMFLKTASFYEEDIKDIFAVLITLIEPILVLTLACVVGFIVMSMFLPMVTMLSEIGR